MTNVDSGFIKPPTCAPQTPLNIRIMLKTIDNIMHESTFAEAPKSLEVQFFHVLVSAGSRAGDPNLPGVSWPHPARRG